MDVFHSASRNFKTYLPYIPSKKVANLASRKSPAGPQFSMKLQTKENKTCKKPKAQPFCHRGYILSTLRYTWCLKFSITIFNLFKQNSLQKSFSFFEMDVQNDLLLLHAIIRLIFVALNKILQTVHIIVSTRISINSNSQLIFDVFLTGFTKENVGGHRIQTSCWNSETKNQENMKTSLHTPGFLNLFLYCNGNFWTEGIVLQKWLIHSCKNILLFALYGNKSGIEKGRNILRLISYGEGARVDWHSCISTLFKFSRANISFYITSW